jgi:hypothetical protein
MIGSFLALMRHPSLWPTALGLIVRLVPRRWWTRPPYLPVPDRAYVRFRMETMYGDEPPVGDDVIAYLEWCRRYRSAQRLR